MRLQKKIKLSENDEKVVESPAEEYDYQNIGEVGDCLLSDHLSD
jgi:hypothetical protein